jgi:hypothetical protein
MGIITSWKVKSGVSGGAGVVCASAGMVRINPIMLTGMLERWMRMGYKAA